MRCQHSAALCLKKMLSNAFMTSRTPSVYTSSQLSGFMIMASVARMLETLRSPIHRENVEDYFTAFWHNQ